MIVTTYMCDNCGHGQSTSEQMWQVGIAVEHANSTSYTSSAWISKQFQHQQLWCRKCIDAIGLLTPIAKPEGDDSKPTAPTFEEMLRSLIRQEIGERS
jgi:hypothetical protein